MVPPPPPPPPPVTPSPHRFVIKKPATAPPSHQASQVSSSQQFNTTPRFSFVAPQRSTVANAFNLDATPSLKHFVTPARLAARPEDSIEDVPDEADLDIHDSVESVNPNLDQQYHSAEEEEEDDYDRIVRNPKRRRLSSSPIVDSASEEISPKFEPHHNEDIQNSHEDFEDLLSSANTIASPPTSIHHRPTAPRFLLHHPATPAPGRGSTPLPPSTPAGSTLTPFAKPPRFRPPDEQSSAARPAEPLPDLFSPQRRGQKFLVGGLAAEVIGWVMNIEGSLSGVAAASAPALGGSSTRFQREGQREEGWVVKMVVEEVSGGVGAGMTLVRGRRVVQVRNSARLEDFGEVEGEEAGGRREGEEVVDYLGVMKIILVGSGLAEGLQQGNKVEEGRMVRIKQPVWEVVLDGERWGVAVTWEVHP